MALIDHNDVHCCDRPLLNTFSLDTSDYERKNHVVDPYYDRYRFGTLITDATYARFSGS
jgi:hypothetical protein